MPGNMSAAQEKLWDRAKEAAAKSKDKTVGQLKGDDYALVQYIFQKMKKAHGESRMNIKAYQKRLESFAASAKKTKHSFDCGLYESRMKIAKRQLEARETKKLSDQEKRAKMQKLLNQLHALKLDKDFSKQEIDQIINGYKIPTPGDIQDYYGGRANAVDSYKEPYQHTAVDHIIDNRQKGVFEGGFKYLELPGGGEKWLRSNGFTVDHDSIDPEYSQSSVKDPYYAQKHWINPRTKVVITGNPKAFGEGGYSGVYGPEKEAKATFNQLLKDASYVKDVHAYSNHLGGTIDHDEYMKLLDKI